MTDAITIQARNTARCASGHVPPKRPVTFAEIRRISQEGLALLAEVDRSYVGRVERGDNNVAVLTLVKIANALQITLTSLMKEAGI